MNVVRNTQTKTYIVEDETGANASDPFHYGNRVATEQDVEILNNISTKHTYHMAIRVETKHLVFIYEGDAGFAES